MKVHLMSQPNRNTFNCYFYYYFAESQIHEAEQFEWLTKEHLCVLVYLVRMSFCSSLVMQ